MNEATIIKQRLAINEVAYKRILKLSQSQPNKHETPPWDSMAAEFAHFETLLNKLQLQVDTGKSEIENYQEQKIATEAKIMELNDWTVELEAKLSEAQKLRDQRQECNTLVDSMLKAKKVLVGSTPIIALLDSSRSEDMSFCSSLEEEIQELEGLRKDYGQLWDSKKVYFDNLVKYMLQFKSDIHTVGSVKKDSEDSEEGSASPEASVEPTDGRSVEPTDGRSVEHEQFTEDVAMADLSEVDS